MMLRTRTTNIAHIIFPDVFHFSLLMLCHELWLGSHIVCAQWLAGFIIGFEGYASDTNVPRNDIWAH